MGTADNKTTRRAALRHLAGSAPAAAGVLPIVGQNPPPESHHSMQPVTKQVAAAYQYRFFSPEQLRTLNALGETIIPADEHSPGAKEARVSEYIDAIATDFPEETKKLWRDGLQAVEKVSHSKFGRTYDSCSKGEQIKITSTFAGDEKPGTSPDGDFFIALKRAVIDGYYTSPIGMFTDLQYVGNQAMPDFPGCQFAEIKSESSS